MYKRQAQHAAGVKLIINSGSSVPSSRRSVELARKWDFVLASVGVFPLEAYTVEEGWLAQIEAMAKDPRVVAIGEIGLDYFQPDADRETQKKVFAPQLELAKRLSLPVVIHDRDADEDMLAMLGENPGPGMIHRFFSKAEYGFAFLDKGLYLGIGPAITYSNADHLIEVVRKMPLDQLVLETDCPWLPTQSHEEMCIRDSHSGQAGLEAVHDLRISRAHSGLGSIAVLIDVQVSVVSFHCFGSGQIFPSGAVAVSYTHLVGLFSMRTSFTPGQVTVLCHRVAGIL